MLICILSLLTECGKETEDDEQYNGNYEYEILEDDTVMILSYNGSEEQVFIPEKLEGKIVSAIGDKAFYSNGNVQEVLLPSGVVSIGESAFAYCASLLEIRFPEELVETWNEICIYCSSLEKVFLPQIMEHMGLNVFTGSSNLQLIYGSTSYAKRYAIKEGKTYVDINRIEQTYVEGLE